MELEELITTMDKVAANLAKMTAVWERAQPMLPSGPSRGRTPEYEDLARGWNDLRSGLPPIDGWTITSPLPDQDDIGSEYIDYFEVGESPHAVHEAVEQPGRDLAEYRFRLRRAQRRAIRERLIELTGLAEATIARINAVEREDVKELVTGPDVVVVREAVSEIERLLGDTVTRTGRWGYLHRHLAFGQDQDWHDIANFDWPTIRVDIDAATFGDTDPIPVDQADLGVAAMSHPTGGVTTALDWTSIDAEQFERLLYDLLRGLPGYQNVELLMRTNAPDRGRDLSLERVIDDAGGGVRTERVLVQAKHFTTRSVRPTDILETLANVGSWEPPPVRFVVIATSGRFTADAVTLTDHHNAAGKQPQIELWPENRLETLLAQRADLIASHRLR